MSRAIEGLHFETLRPIRLTLEGDRIVRVDELGTGGDGSSRLSSELTRVVAPAFWDLQNNGGMGISYSDEGLTVDQVVERVLEERARGVGRVCPTLITASLEAMRHGVATIDAACRREGAVGRMVVGIHLEGPHISPEDGYRGAHPLEHVRPPSIEEFESLWQASGQRIRIVTLAPEWPGAERYIEHLARERGILVALGHTAADGPTIARAVAAGARLSTHLGNGIAVMLPRHPNPIWSQLAQPELAASMIADGEHTGAEFLRVVAEQKRGRLVLVSDMSPLAGMQPGRYGNWEVEPSGRIVVAGTPYLAGAWRPLEQGLRNLARATGWDWSEILACVTTTPARLLGEPAPALEPGSAGGVILLGIREADRSIELLDW
jgi:N-acetylglucosamine-6-phosphate deacetylase